MNGIQTAADLRKVDDKVVLIFVTFLAKYAIKGYAVDALDYVVKPVNYHTFKLKIARAIERCRKNARGRVFLPTSEGGIGIDIDRPRLHRDPPAIPSSITRSRASIRRTGR